MDRAGVAPTRSGVRQCLRSLSCAPSPSRTSTSGASASEHWAGRLYMRRVSLARHPRAAGRHADQRERVSRSLMIPVGLLAGLVPHPSGPCGRVRGRRLSPSSAPARLLRRRGRALAGDVLAAGVYLDALGHYIIEAALPAALGIRADGWLGLDRRLDDARAHGRGAGAPDEGREPPRHRRAGQGGAPAGPGHDGDGRPAADRPEPRAPRARLRPVLPRVRHRRVHRCSRSPPRSSTRSPATSSGRGCSSWPSSPWRCSRRWATSSPC